MTGRTHMAIGAAVSIGISVRYLHVNHTMLEMGLFVCTTALGSLLPDVDHPTSTLSRRSPHFSRWLHKYYCAAGALFGSLEDQAALNAHRGICHSLSACISTLLLLSLFLFTNQPGTFILFGFILGMFLHILADCLTPSGTMLFAPFCFHYYSLRFKKPQKEKVEHHTSIKSIFLYLPLYALNLILGMTWFLYFITAVFIFNLITQLTSSSFSTRSLPMLLFLLILIVLNFFTRIFRHNFAHIISEISGNAVTSIINNTAESVDKTQDSDYE